MNREWLLFEQWRNRTALPIVLVAGNHDIVDRKKYEELHIPVVNEWLLDGFLLTHFPEEREGLYTISGHIHPSIVLAGEGRQFLKLPCFFNRHSKSSCLLLVNLQEHSPWNYGKETRPMCSQKKR